MKLNSSLESQNCVCMYVFMSHSLLFLPDTCLDKELFMLHCACDGDDDKRRRDGMI